MTAHAEDGIIEAVELASYRFAIGVQSHPETLFRVQRSWQNVFTAFVDAARSSYSEASERRSLSTEAAEAV